MKNLVEWEVKEEIGILTISNPPENYLYEPEFVPLATLQSWTSDPSLKGILIHGKGKHFSAGGDLRRMAEMIANDEGLEEKISAGHAVIRHLIATRLPMVAAIHGVCFGGGLELALACHIRIASENALFAAPETGHGIIPGMGGTFRLPKTVGTGRAMQMILSGDMISADEALKIHLIDRIAPGKTVFGTAFSILKNMTKNLSPKIVRAVMTTLENASELKIEDAITEETRIFCELANEEFKRRESESNA